MKILIAPDKFKGSLSAIEVCQAIDRGLKLQGKKLDINFHPMADGGDGSLEILSEFLKLKKQIVQTIDPLGRKISAPYYTSSDAAFIELASASGLVLLNEEERNPLKSSTLGTGKMIADAITNGFQNIYLFLGGSATNDAGIGIAEALGFQFLDKNKNVLDPIGESLSHIKTIQQNATFNFTNLNITLLCDVTNPLFGSDGAAYVYASQKGASTEDIKYLDEGLKNFSKVVFQQKGIDPGQLIGGGAAGGVGAGLTALLGAKIEMGFAIISNLTDLEKQIQQADWVISGEGKLDIQSLQGKVIDGLAKLCKKYQKPLVLFVGKNELSKQAAINLGTKRILSISEKANNLNDAMTNGAKYLEELAAELLITNTSRELNSIFEKTEKNLIEAGFEFERKDFNRPWGGFWVIKDTLTQQFFKQYFPKFTSQDLTKGLKVSPKILLVAPHKRLSWQYHFRRSEVWKVIKGKVGVVRSNSDEETPLKIYSVGEIIILQKEERHRLVGLEDWGMVAEIWQHTDPMQPSDENDIVRLQDDFDRKTPESN